MSSRRRWVMVLAVCLIAVGAAGATFAGVRLLARNGDYKAARGEYDRLRAGYVAPAQGAAQAGGRVQPADIDVKALQAENPDCVGWIEIPGTDISYPILQGASNETYLRHTFDKSYLLAGAIFMDFRDKGDYSGFNTIIFGHNMRDGTMFSELGSFLDADFLKDNDTIFIHTTGGVLTYKVLAARATDVHDLAYQVVDPDAAEARRFVLELGDAFADTGAEEHFLTLSTCSDGADMNARTLVLARQSR